VSETVEIVRLGHAGDGVAADGTFVPGTVPGDVVRVERDGARARLVELIRPGAARAQPACAHFGACGGCALQHVEHETYLAWKRDGVVAALASRGFADVAVDPIVAVPPGTRRRASFKALRRGDTMLLGFYERDSHTIVDIGACPVLVRPLERLLPRLRLELACLLRNGESAELHITALGNAVDVALKLKRPRDAGLLMDLASLTAALNLTRLTWNGELVAQNEPPILSIGRFRVALPPEAFLQPTAEGEGILQSLVAEGIGTAKRVADLFAGVGTFALALAEGRDVHAVDSDAAMIEALGAAARQGRARVTTEARDLFRRPLLPVELKRFEAVVIDPPRPGAKAQAEALAQSSLPRVIYVSCNPASFARDARVLADGGYRLGRVQPIDQFVWSPHTELVGIFER
jgi:23S rRNA (uracil1939-C5)-methyltransferase